jgi:hypothetical protein
VRKLHFFSLIAAFFVFFTMPAEGVVIEPTNPNILYTGRIQFSDPLCPVFSHIGCSIKFNFNGTGVSASFASSKTSYLYVIIDDDDVHNRKVLTIDPPKQSYELVSNLADGRHSVEIVKLTQYDSKVYFFGLNVDGKGLAEKPARPPLTLEFYGDSNAAGTSAWDPQDSGTDAVNEGYFTFPGITARMLNAEYSNISGGGAGVTSQGWWNLVDVHHLYHMNDPVVTSNIWDFKNNYWNFSPDAVIINLSANDYYNHVSKNTIKEGWKNFITKYLRVHYPKAHIVLVDSYGWAYNEPADYVHEAVQELYDAGEKNVSYLKFPWLWSQAHAVVCEHAGFANLLASHLALHLGLPQPQPNDLSCFAAKGKVANGSFEKSILSGEADGWRSTGSVTLVTDPATAVDGDRYFHFGSGGSAHFANDANAGDSFLVTAWMRVTNGSQGQLKLEFKDQSQKIIGTGTVGGLHPLTEVWQLVSTAGVVPKGTWQVNVVIGAPTGSAIDADLVNMQYASMVHEPCDQQPIANQLYQNFPNPFNSKTEIRFQLSQPAPVLLDVYNVFGETVDTLINKKLEGGQYIDHLDGSSLAGGIYYYQIRAGDFVQTKKCLLLK